MQITKFDITCPRWALPEEELPVHVKIEKESTVKIKDVVIYLPQDLRLADTINIEDYETKDGRMVVRNIGKITSSAYDYFGIVVASKITNALKKQIPIHFRFNFHDGTFEEHKTYARIFRPLLQVTECPQKIILTDKSSHKITIPISLKFTGFGDIRLRCECQIGGKIVSKGTFMIDEILSRIIEAESIDVPENGNIKVDPEYVSQLANDVRKMLGEEGIGKLLRKHGHDIRTEAQNMTQSERESFMSILYKNIENYVINILSDILRRNISSQLQLESQVSIYTQIKLPVTNVTIKIYYEDLLFNKYTPIERAVEIVDHRKNSSDMVEIPLTIKNVDEVGSFKDVGTMEIGTD